MKAVHWQDALRAACARECALKDKLARIRKLVVYDKRLIGETEDVPVFAMSGKPVLDIIDEEGP